MTLSSAVANFGLSAIATPTSTNVTNDVRIGVAPAALGFPDADVAYSFRVTSIFPALVTELTYSTGVVTGPVTVTVLDGDGKDFEGIAISMPKLYGVIIQGDVPGGIGEYSYVNSHASLPDGAIAVNDTVATFFAEPLTVTAETLTLTSTSEGVYQVTVIGKSS
tara:strand:+ start:1698 stop:2189 length:492 start_codon:yes stop_codon:yes gene_type:complete